MSLSLLLAGLCQQPGGLWSYVEDWNVDLADAHFGSALVALDDLSGDGLAEIAVGAPQGDPALATFGRGRVFVYTTTLRRSLYELSGVGAADGYGAALAAIGDCEGDGIGDLAIGTRLWTDAYVELRSGALGSLIERIVAPPGADGFGWSLAPAGDLDRDGTEDLWIAARAADPGGLANAGAIYGYSGRTRQILLTLEGTTASQFFGKEMASGGDVNGDGRGDLLVQDLGAGAGSVLVVSTANGQILRQHAGTVGRHVNLGHALCFVGDLNLDGCDDYLIADQFYEDANGKPVGGAWIHSGADGALLWSQEGAERDDRYGSAVAALGDLNGDLVPEFAVGASRARRSTWTASHRGIVDVHSGADFMILQTLPGDAAVLDGVYEFGHAILGLGDGRNDVLVGAPASRTGSANEAGSVHLYDLEPWIQATSASVSVSAGGPWSLSLDFPSAFAGRAYQILPSPVDPNSRRDERWVRWQGVPLPIIASPLAAAMWSGGPDFWFDTAGVLDADGNATCGMVLQPNGAVNLIGASLRFAAILPPSGGEAPVSSSAVTVRFLP